MHLISPTTQEVGHAQRRGEEGRLGERKRGEGERYGAFTPPLVLKEQQGGKIDTVSQRERREPQLKAWGRRSASTAEKKKKGGEWSSEITSFPLIFLWLFFPPLPPTFLARLAYFLNSASVLRLWLCLVSVIQLFTCHALSSFTRRLFFVRTRGREQRYGCRRLTGNCFRSSEFCVRVMLQLCCTPLSLKMSWPHTRTLQHIHYTVHSGCFVRIKTEQ